MKTKKFKTANHRIIKKTRTGDTREKDVNKGVWYPNRHKAKP